MTDAPVDSPAPELRSELRNWCEAWKTCLQNVLSQVSGQPIAFEISSQRPASTASDLWYTVVAGGATHGEMTLRLAAASGTRLARKFLGETGPAAAGTSAEPTAAESTAPENIVPEGITPEDKEALEELLRQIAGLAATALGSIAGGEVQLHLSPSAAPSWSSDAIVCLHTRDEAGTSIVIEIQISPALAAALQPRPSPRLPRQSQRQQQPRRRLCRRPSLRPPPVTAGSWMSASTSNFGSEPAACCCATCSPSAPESSSSSITLSIRPWTCCSTDASSPKAKSSSSTVNTDCASPT